MFIPFRYRLEALLEKTSREDQKIARTSALNIRTSTKHIQKTRTSGIKIQESGDFFTIPKKALLLLFDIISNMAEGKSLTLIPSDSEITTQQAADMLNMSRPFVVKLLETGEIPFKKVGSHRRIKLTDLIKYEAKIKDYKN